MSRSTTPWAATSVPDIRRLLCTALDTLVDRQAPALEVHGDKRLQRMQAKFSEALEQSQRESEIVAAAPLYWVTRDMVDMVVRAAESLPEWTPMLAAPSTTGLLCWARPAGQIHWTQFRTDLDVTWDAVTWYIRDDGALIIQPLSRLAKNPELLKPFDVSTPLWASGIVQADSRCPRTEESTGSPEGSRFVSVLGAAWLLMGQPSVAEQKVIGDRPAPTPTTNHDRTPPTTRANVTLVDLRRREQRSRRPATGSGKPLDHRVPVTGHWRQVACGPGHSQRQPRWIDDYEKGPEGAPPIKRERVHVLRK